MTYQDIETAFADTGLIVRGGFEATADEDPASGTIVMIGNAGPDMWDHFAPPIPDGPNPLDTWTKDLVAPLAEKLGAVALHPNDKPYRPFQQWAARAETVHPSPLGILIHPDHGLWHAYRAALVFDGPVNGLPSKTGSANPCDTCTDKPCLTTCPVGAFSTNGYNVPKCIAHLRTPHGQPCHDGGCQARMACPIATDQQYTATQRAFHAAAFYQSHQ
ncbi:MAG: hypothetical protein ACR2O4_08760 [Hyphomicrobiaceae bacterium]